MYVPTILINLTLYIMMILEQLWTPLELELFNKSKSSLNPDQVVDNILTYIIINILFCHYHYVFSVYWRYH